MSIELGIAIFAVGMFCGVIAVRYGIGLGVKLYYSIRDDVPIYDQHKPTEQEITGE
jgi:hypothetical protein